MQYDKTSCNHYLKILDFRSKGETNCTRIKLLAIVLFFGSGLPTKTLYSFFLEAFAPFKFYSR